MQNEVISIYFLAHSDGRQDDFKRTLTEGGTVSTGYVGGFGFVDGPTANVGSNICGGTIPIRPQKVDGTITYFNWL